jgi:preprotein translocase subunit SecF
VVELKFKHPVRADEVRARAEAAGLKDVSVQGIGAASENSFLLRLGGTTQLTAENAQAVLKALEGMGKTSNFVTDVENGLINFRSAEKIAPETVRAAVAAAGLGVKEVRDLGPAQGGGQDYQIVASGMADRITQGLSKGLAEPDFVTQRIDYVGPQVGKELRNKGIAALLYSMVAILLYVAFRFDLKFAPGAVLAMIHDVIMVAGYYLLTRREFNLTSIAALLTITGYSINDTIVIYDRIREEMAKFRGKPLPDIINIAVNETLSRTILTSGVTALSLVGLLIFGVGEIWDFAMAMLVGIIVGTYSSVYIASPLTIWIDQRAAARDRSARAGGISRIV